MILLTIVGVIAFIAGLVFLSGEKNARAVNKTLTAILNKTMVSVDETVFKYRNAAGISLILVGLFCFFIAYWLNVAAPRGVKIF